MRIWLPAPARDLGSTVNHSFGALLEGDGAWDGALFLVEFPSQDEAARFLADEPYNAAGLFSECPIRRWTMGGRENLSAIGALK